MNLKPEHKLAAPPSLVQSIKAIITASCTPHALQWLYRTDTFIGLNLLLAFIPVSVRPAVHSGCVYFSLTSC